MLAIASLATTTAALPIIGLLVFGALRLGRLEARFDALEEKVDRLEEKVDRLIASVNETNKVLVALANHRHDMDGNTVFTMPAIG